MIFSNLNYKEMIMAVLDITNANFDETVKTAKPVLIDFGAPWWPGCVQLSPELQAAEAELGDKAVIAQSNVDNARELAVKFKFMSIPTLIVLKDGKEVDRHTGYMPKKDLVDFVSKHI